MTGSAAGLREALEEIPAVDQHAHFMARESFELASLLSESTEPAAAARMRDHPAFVRAIRALSDAVGCEPREDAIAEVRREMGFEAYARRLFELCRFEAMLLDDGFAIPGALTFDEQADLAGCPVRRIIRIEAEAERAAAGSSGWDETVDRFRTALEAGFHDGAVGLKTIAAYRSGLDLPWTADAADAADRYGEWAAGGHRLSDPLLIRWFIGEALRVASEARGTGAVPLQVHTGFGDHDLFLPHADPSRFRWYFECGEPGTEAPVVFLHCYPFVQEAGYLAHIYDRAYVDLSYALTFASHRGAEMILDVLDLAPASKLLFATDANRAPEPFFLGATWWRDSLAQALGPLVDAGDVEADTALRWGELVLAGTARRLYGLAEPAVAPAR